MADERQPGDLVAEKYRLVELIGEGGFGVVWSAIQLGVDRKVAMKFLKRGVATDEVLRRFKREARALARLQHPGCVALFDFGNDGGLFLVTEFIEGEELKDWAAQPRRTVEKVQVCLGLLDALAHAHEHAIVHRDLKPPNVFVCRGFDGWTVKVLDFGISSVVGEKRGSITKTGDVFGTPGYMSPEQLKGFETGPPTDVYACGVLFYELFAAESLFPSNSSIQLMMKHMTEPAPRLSAVGDGLANVVARMLEKEPADRYRNGAAALTALLEATAAPPPVHPPPRAAPAPAPATPAATTSKPDHRGISVVAAGLVMAVLACIGFLVVQFIDAPNDEPAPAPRPRLVAPAPPAHVAEPCASQDVPPGELAKVGSDLVYVPSGYAPDKRHPMLFVHRSPKQPPLEPEPFAERVAELLDAPLHLRSFADDGGWIVWFDEGRATVTSLDVAADKLCIDDGNIMLVSIDPTDAWDHGGARGWVGRVRGSIRVVSARVGMAATEPRLPSVTLFPFRRRPTSVIVPTAFVPIHRTKDALCVQVAGIAGAGCLSYPSARSPIATALDVFDRAQRIAPRSALPPVAGEPAYIPDGCGRDPLPEGLQRIPATNDYEADLWAYVPAGLNTSQRHPLIVLPGQRARWAHMTGAVPGEGILRERFDRYQLKSVAEQMDAVIVFSTHDTFDAAQAVSVRRATCYDEDQVWAIGIPPAQPKRAWPYWYDLPVKAMANIEGREQAPGDIPTLRVKEGFPPRMATDIVEFFTRPVDHKK